MKRAKEKEFLFKHTCKSCGAETKFPVDMLDCGEVYGHYEEMEEVLKSRVICGDESGVWFVSNDEKVKAKLTEQETKMLEALLTAILQRGQFEPI